MQRILKISFLAAYLLLINFIVSFYSANAQLSGQTESQVLSQRAGQPEHGSEISNNTQDRYVDPLQHYTVQDGDTLLSIALEINVDLNEMYCILAPNFQRTEPLIIGERLSLPVADAACHLTESGDSLATVAEKHNVPVSELVNMAWNQAAYPGLTTLLPDSPLWAGLFLRIPPPYPPVVDEQPMQDVSQDIVNLAEMLQRPIEMKGPRSAVDATTRPLMAVVVGDSFKDGRQDIPMGIDDRGRKNDDFPTVSILNGPILSEKDGLTIIGPTPSEWPYGSGEFIWPLQGWLTQDYHTHHRAVDIAVPLGTPIVATDRGTVVRAGWNDQGYGLFVIIDHNIGYVTLYAHMSEVWVTEGEVVTQGQFLGAVGSTGNSTGPHLHFELRDFGQRVDPLQYLSE